MDLNNIIIVGILLNVLDKVVRAAPSSDVEPVIHEKNRAQLINLINLLNQQNEYRKDILDGAEDNNKIDSEETISRLNRVIDKTMREKVKELMRLTQKNYDAGARAEEKRLSDSGARIVFISNPEELEAYRNSWKKKEKSTSASSGSDDDFRTSLKGILEDLRRNSVVHVRQPSDEAKDREAPIRENRALDNNNDDQTMKNVGTLKSFSAEKADNSDLFRPKPKYKRKPKPSVLFEHKLPSKKHRPFKAPVAFHQPRYDDWKPKKPSYVNAREDFRQYGRTSIPFIGKKGIYDEK